MLLPVIFSTKLSSPKCKQTRMLAFYNISAHLHRWPVNLCGASCWYRHETHDPSFPNYSENAEKEPKSVGKKRAVRLYTGHRFYRVEITHIHNHKRVFFPKRTWQEHKKTNTSFRRWPTPSHDYQAKITWANWLIRQSINPLKLPTSVAPRRFNECHCYSDFFPLYAGSSVTSRHRT